MGMSASVIRKLRRQQETFLAFGVLAMRDRASGFAKPGQVCIGLTQPPGILLRVTVPLRRVFAGIILLFAMLLGARCEAQQPDQGQSGGTNQQTSPSSQQGSPAPESNQDNQEPPKPSLLTPLKHQVDQAPYIPITARQRLRWFITDTIGPQHLLGGVFTSAFGTELDRPKEYGSSWDGFAERFGIRLSGVSVSNAMEASIGSIWGEDPRYFAVPQMPFKARWKNVVRQTFVARRRDGSYSPAYARYIAFTGNNFLSNTWRADSEANTHDAIIRTGEGFAGRMAANAFEEFWPSIKGKVFHRKE